MAGVPNREARAQDMRQRIARWTGLPVCVGIAPTKTLAKLANHAAKKGLAGADGVCDLSAMPKHSLDALLAGLDVGEVWGVGGRIKTHLVAMDILTVAQLRDADATAIRSRFGVVMERTVRELRGESCLALEAISPPKQQIMCSRSFGQEVTTLSELKESILTYVSRAAEKLRRQQSLTSAVMVFAHTNQHKDVPQYSRRMVVPLTHPTDDTLLLGRAACAGLERIYQPGFSKKKSGTMLMELIPKAQRQVTLFENTEHIAMRERVTAVLDRINGRYGRCTLALAGAGLDRPWTLKAENRTPPYTTSWMHLPRVR